MTTDEKHKIIFSAILEWKRCETLGLLNKCQSPKSFYEVISELSCSPLIYGEILHQQDFDYQHLERGFEFTEGDIQAVLSQPLKNFI